MAYARHYEESASLAVSPARVFEVVDDHARFSEHMTRRSWRMGGARMDVSTDEGHGRSVGSHIRMKGRVLGVPIALDEVVTQRDPPRVKAWETVGAPQLLVVGPYKMTVEARPEDERTRLRVAIDYDPPRRAWIGKLFGGWYASWCVRRILGDVGATLARA